MFLKKYAEFVLNSQNIIQRNICLKAANLIFLQSFAVCTVLKKEKRVKISEEEIYSNP